MKNLRSLACKFELDQSESKSSQAFASTRKSWPNGVANYRKFSTCDNLRLCLARALNGGQKKPVTPEKTLWGKKYVAGNLGNGALYSAVQ